MIGNVAEKDVSYVVRRLRMGNRRGMMGSMSRGMARNVSQATCPICCNGSGKGSDVRMQVLGARPLGAAPGQPFAVGWMLASQTGAAGTDADASRAQNVGENLSQM